MIRPRNYPLIIISLNQYAQYAQKIRIHMKRVYIEESVTKSTKINVAFNNIC